MSTEDRGGVEARKIGLSDEGVQRVEEWWVHARDAIAIARPYADLALTRFNDLLDTCKRLLYENRALRAAPPSGLTPPSGGATAPDPREAQLRAAAQRLLAAFDADPDALEPARTGLGDYRWDRALDAALKDLRDALTDGPTSPVAGAPQHEN